MKPTILTPALSAELVREMKRPPASTPERRKTFERVNTVRPLLQTINHTGR